VGPGRPALPRPAVGPRRDEPRPQPSRGGRCAGRAGPHPRARLEPLRHRARLAGRPHPRPAARHRPAGMARGGPAGAGVLRQLRRRGQRVRAEAGPPVRGAGPPRRGQRPRLVPRPHPGHAPRHRPALEARGVPAPAGGLPARRVVRPRGARGGPRSDRRRGAARAGAGGGRGQPGHRGVLPGRPAPLRRARDPLHGRRGADRAGSLRRLVRPPAPRGGARRGDDGQGPRQRRAHRGVLGQGRGRSRLRAG
jgi:hypothetical protein